MDRENVLIPKASNRFRVIFDRMVDSDTYCLTRAVKTVANLQMLPPSDTFRPTLVISLFDDAAGDSTRLLSKQIASAEPFSLHVDFLDGDLVTERWSYEFCRIAGIFKSKLDYDDDFSSVSIEAHVEAFNPTVSFPSLTDQLASGRGA